MLAITPQVSEVTRKKRRTINKAAVRSIAGASLEVGAWVFVGGRGAQAHEGGVLRSRSWEGWQVRLLSRAPGSCWGMLLWLLAGGLVWPTSQPAMRQEGHE